MGTESESGGLWSLGGLKGSRKKREAYEPQGDCRNCGAELTGPHCAVCGQLADDFHRPFWSLIQDGLADLFSLDGRLANTLPALMFRPGRMTREYIDGKRAKYVPPFRLFLLASLLFFFILFSVTGGWGRAVTSDEDAQEFAGAIQQAIEEEKAADALSEAPPETPDPNDIPSHEEIQAEIEKAREGLPPGVNISDEGEVSVDVLEGVDRSTGFGRFVARIEQNIEDLSDEPKRLELLIQNWAPRLAFLLLPMTVIGLLLAYPFRNNVFVYDHLIAALHYQTFLYVLFGAAFLISAWGWSSYLVWFLVVLGPPLYFYKMQRRVYDSGRLLTLLRTFTLWIAGWVSVIVIAAMVLATAIYSA